MLGEFKPRISATSNILKWLKICVYLLHGKQKYGTCVGNCVKQYDGNHGFMNTWLASGRELRGGADFIYDLVRLII